MYRTLKVSQKQAASKVFRYSSLLTLVAIGYQSIHESLGDVIALAGLSIGLGILSVAILKGIETQRPQ